MGSLVTTLAGSLWLSATLGPTPSPSPRVLPLSTAVAPRIEQRPATLHGLPLRGAFEITEHDATGHERTVATRSPTAAPRLLPSQARLRADQARARVAALGLGEPRADPQLVYRLVLGRPVLAWEVPLALRLAPAPSLRTVWLDARRGHVIDEIDRAFAAHTELYPENPISTPDPRLVELVTLQVEGAGHRASSDTIDVYGCGQDPYDPAPPWAGAFNCVPQPRAISDDAGDFFVPLPDVGRIADNQAFDDAYAEVAAYHAVERFFATMAERGLTEPRCERFTVLVNMHGTDDDGEPTPIEGASYIDTCNADASPNLVLGQGLDADYAWDVDVLHHELGHSIVQQLTPEGLTERRYAPHGILSEAGAINEGLADYFAMSVAGDPEVAEYVGRITVASGAPYLRTGLNDEACPDDLVSDWHHDGQIVSGALWSIRSRLGPITDELVLRALPRLPPDAVLDDLGPVLLDVATQLHDEGAFDDFALALVDRSLRARGLLHCLHVIDDPELATTGKRMTLVAAGETVAPFAPGPLQLRYEVPADASEITIFFTLAGGEPPERAATLLVSRRGDPIEFAYELVQATDAEGQTFERIEVTADHDLELTPEPLNGEDFIARLPVEPGEILHVALANRSPFAVTASNFFVVRSDPGQSDDEPQEQDDGCGCRAAPPHEGPLPLLLPLLLLGRRRPVTPPLARARACPASTRPRTAAGPPAAQAAARG